MGLASRCTHLKCCQRGMALCGGEILSYSSRADDGLQAGATAAACTHRLAALGIIIGREALRKGEQCRAPATKLLRATHMAVEARGSTQSGMFKLEAWWSKLQTACDAVQYRADAQHNRGSSHGGRMLRLASEQKAAQETDGSLQKVTAFSRVCAPWTPRVFLVGPANDVLVGCLPLSSPGSPPAAAKGTVAHLFAPRTLHCTHPNTRQTSAPPKTHSRLCALSSETGPPSPRAAHGSPTLIRRHCIVPPPLARNSSLRSLH
jgi:hypothetical protein